MPRYMPKTRGRGGRVPGFSTGTQASRRRSRQAARPVSTTAYPHRTANPVHGLSGCPPNSFPAPQMVPPALDGR